MSKFCSECGTMLADAAKFCTACGTPCEPMDAQQPAPNQKPQYVFIAEDSPSPARAYEAAPPAPASYPQPAEPSYSAQPPYGSAAPIPAQSAYVPAHPAAEKKSKKKLIITLSIIGVLLIGGGILLFILLGGKSTGASSPEELVNKMVELENTPDPGKEECLSLMYEYVFEADNDKKQAMYDSFEVSETIEDTFGSDYRITITVLNSESFSDAEMLQWIAKNEQYYKDTDKIKEIRKVWLQMAIAGSKGSETLKQTKYFINCNGRWFWFDP